MPVVGLLGPNSGQRMIACVAALFGVLLTGVTCSFLPFSVAGLPLLLGAVGSVSVLLFVVPSSPFAQPWAIIGGNVASAIVGVLCAHFIPQPVVAAAVSVGGAILVMSLLRCMHPPGGASALAGVMGGPAVLAASYAYPAILLVDCVVLVAAAWLIHQFTGHRYPHVQAAAPAQPAVQAQPAGFGASPPPRSASPAFAPAALDRLARQAASAPASPVFGATTVTPTTFDLKHLRLSVKATLLVAMSLIALAVVTFFATRYIMSSGAESRAVERQEANMRVARDILNQYGTGFSVVDDQLLIGSRPLNGFVAPVDRVKQLVGGTATVFLGDRRITTNVKNPDGSRAIGTTLTSDEVRHAVLQQGQSYRGRADILGRSFFTAYDPIRDQSGKVIGILYVGIPASDFLSDVSRAETQIAAIGAVVTLLAALIGLMLTRRMFAPLSDVCDRMGELARGKNDIEIANTDRHDEIGTIARAVAVFRDLALSKEAADAMQQAVVSTLADQLRRLADGDLTTRIDVQFPDDYAQIQTDFNAAVAALDEAMGSISEHSADIRSAVVDLSRASDGLAQLTEQNAANIEEASAGLDEATAKGQDNADQVRKAKAVITAATAGTSAGSAILRDAVAAMNEIGESSSKIANITGIIDGLAFQTNLLALNAGVEAARAGDAGAGFAVVAAEVRALAQRSADAAREIKALISVSSQQVQSGAELVDRTGVALTGIAGEIDTIATLVGQIAESTVQQASGLSVVNTSIGDISSMTQRSAASVEENNAVTHSLAGDATTLDALVARFRISDAQADHGRPAQHGHAGYQGSRMAA
ncbi:MAG TPA: methyl-accepting chemotaxis protein [Sphingomonas sp.]|uniref:methyl-accepting chemotaxis protein n=1 Tax=Sphingomonas sp. TaxID=28214 RepID=UPI002ED80F75